MTVVDNDETVIPRISETYTSLEDYHRFLLGVELDTSYTRIGDQIDAIKCEHTNHSAIQTYIDRVHVNPSPATLSFYFQQAFYMNDKIVEQLIDKLGEQIDAHRLAQTVDFNITLQIAEDDAKFTFKISNKDDLLYAKNLVKLSKQYIRPFMQKNREKLSHVSENYRRVFALVSEGDNQFTSGKSVHTTNHTRNICVHSLCSKRDRLVKQSTGHLSHFRRFFVFRKQILFSIKQLVFDFNYFNCFVKPILEDK